MLLQLTVENFRSISDEVELSMRASDDVPRQESDRAQPVLASVGADLKVLRCAAIYGANASGKSNLVEALQVARRLVVHGTSSKDERLGVQPFLLDTARQGQPSRFELYLLVSDQVYGYGFAATNRGITEESLTMMLDGVETEVFARRDGQVRIADVLVTGLEDPKFLEYVARGTPENQLFLHEAMLRNVASRPIGDVFRWFEDHLRIIMPSSTPTELVRLADADPEFREFLMRAVAWADTGIKQIYVDRRRLDEGLAAFWKGVFAKAKESGNDIDVPSMMDLVPLDDGGVNRLQLALRHSDDASLPAFSLSDESDGTRRLLDLAPVLYRASKGPTVLVIDEIDRSLHTLLAQQIVETFVAQLPATTQLLFTTHDTNLLDCRSLRPDCIWFTEKSPSGATSLFSLSEFPPEQIAVLSKDLENGYLRGRFGALPFLGDPARLGWIPRKGGDE